MMKQQEKFMRAAIRLSYKGMKEKKGGPFGAVVVKDEKIIARANNLVTSVNDPTAHAEVTAIRKACRKLSTYELSGCEIYCSCEPCPMCLGAIYWARISVIYFAATRIDAAWINFDDNYIYNELNKSFNERQIKTIQIRREEAMKVFEEWKQMEDKIQY
jgi:tRNA(Arg) A34 adenosine deaminase TadA